MVVRQKTQIIDSESERCSDSDSSSINAKPMNIKRYKASRSSDITDDDDDDYLSPSKVAPPRRRSRARKSAKNETVKTTKRAQKSESAQRSKSVQKSKLAQRSKPAQSKTAPKSKTAKPKSKRKVTRGVQTDEVYERPKKRTRMVYVQIAAPRKRAQGSKSVRGEQKTNQTKTVRRRKIPAIII
jgi:hypothetical protein